MIEIEKSSLNQTDKYQSVCRFCFGKREIDEIFFDIFRSKVGDTTLFESIKTSFAVLERNSYDEYVAGKRWTSEYLEVGKFAINDDDTLLRGICVKCLQVLIEINSLADRIRVSNLEQFTQAAFKTKLEYCDLKTEDGSNISHGQIMSALDLKQRSPVDDLANFWDTCRFCLKHETALLFDIFTSKIEDNSIVDVIKICTATYKHKDVHIFVHLRKSYVKTIIVPDYEWPDIEGNGPRKICIQCLQPLLKFKFLIDRIRKTNAALHLVDLSCNLKGYVGICLLHTTLQKLLDKCVLKTGTGEIISTQQVLHTIRLTELSFRSLMEHNEMNKILVTPYQYCADYKDPMSNVFVKDTSVGTNLNICCKLCNNVIDAEEGLDAHIWMHVQEANNARLNNVCKTCLRVIVTGDDRYYSPSNSSDWKHCSMCKLRKYLDNIDETAIAFEEFSKQRFD